MGKHHKGSAYKLNKKLARERDRGMCQVHGCTLWNSVRYRKTIPNVHHCLSLSCYHGLDRHFLWNLVTVCQGCHDKMNRGDTALVDYFVSLALDRRPPPVRDLTMADCLRIFTRTPPRR